MKSIFKTILLLIVCSIFINLNAQNTYLSQSLKNAISDKGNNGQYSVLIVLNEQINFEILKTDFNEKKINVEKRAKTVIKLLHEQKNKYQKDIIGLINKYNSAKTNKIEVKKQFWISNLILVETDKNGIDYLLNCEGINYLELASQGVELIEPIETPRSKNTKD